MINKYLFLLSFFTLFSCTQKLPENPFKAKEKGLWLPVGDYPDKLSFRYSDAKDSIAEMNIPFWLLHENDRIITLLNHHAFDHEISLNDAGFWEIGYPDFYFDNIASADTLYVLFNDAYDKVHSIKYIPVLSGSQPESFAGIASVFMQSLWSDEQKKMLAFNKYSSMDIRSSVEDVFFMLYGYQMDSLHTNSTYDYSENKISLTVKHAQSSKKLLFIEKAKRSYVLEKADSLHASLILIRDAEGKAVNQKIAWEREMNVPAALQYLIAKDYVGFD